MNFKKITSMSLATISILALSFSNPVISNAMEKDINLKNEKNIRLENGDTISISVDKPSIPKGGRVTFSGYATDKSGAPIANRTVYLLENDYPKEYTSVKDIFDITKTDSNGYYSFSFTVSYTYGYHPFFVMLSNGKTIDGNFDFGNTSTWNGKWFIDGRDYDFADVLSKYSGVFISQHM